MGWLVATILAIGTVTTLAARLLVSRNPTGSTAAHVMLAAASVPLASGVVAAVVIALQFAQKTPDTHNGSFGMSIFALVMFWFYGLMASVVVGLPTAIVAVRAFQRG